MKPQDAPRIRRFREELREPLMTHIGELVQKRLSTEQIMDLVIDSNRAVLGVIYGSYSRSPIGGRLKSLSSAETASAQDVS